MTVKNQRIFLKIIFALNLIFLIPLLLRKRPIKDWIIVYLFNAVTNGVIDNILTKRKIVRYPIKIFSTLFDTHILFDYFLYPTFTILFNQLTYKDKPAQIIKKLFIMTLPPFLIEFWAERKTNLIKWGKKWKWYHTFLAITIKSLVTRFAISVIRKIDTMMR